MGQVNSKGIVNRGEWAGRHVLFAALDSCKNYNMAIKWYEKNPKATLMTIMGLTPLEWCFISKRVSLARFFVRFEGTIARMSRSAFPITRYLLMYYPDCAFTMLSLGRIADKDQNFGTPLSGSSWKTRRNENIIDALIEAGATTRAMHDVRKYSLIEYHHIGDRKTVAEQIEKAAKYSISNGDYE